jgi:hypothetical protein
MMTMASKVKTGDALAVECAISKSVSRNKTVWIEVDADAVLRLVEYVDEHAHEWDEAKSVDTETGRTIIDVWGTTAEHQEPFRLRLELCEG